jgi:CTD small phosphatase-like protein 2
VDPIPDADVRFPVTFNNANYEVYVRKRPHLDKFFALIAGKFEVTVFTASQQVYAERLLNLLDPEGKHIHNRLYRDSCLNVDGNFLKDLNVLGRDLTKTVLVDNSPHAFGYQLENGVPIESWFEDKSDTELLKVRASAAAVRGPYLLASQETAPAHPTPTPTRAPPHTPFSQLAAFVHTLLGQDDVRSVVRDRFHLHALVSQSQLPPGY